MSPLRLTLTRTLNSLAAVVLERVSIATENYMASMMYVRLVLIRGATDIRKAAYKNLKLAQERLSKDYD